jgi:hypothetical protein
MFLAIWRGKGLWAIVLPCLTLTATALLASYLVPGKAPDGANIYLSQHDWPLAAAFFVAGVACLALGLVGNYGPGVPVVERETGRKITVRVRHSLYKIPVEYWSIPYLLLGWYFLFHFRR